MVTLFKQLLGGESVIHYQASKAKNGQIQMHSHLLSSGISIQSLTGISQEKRSEARRLLLDSSAHCSQWDMSHTYKSKLVLTKSSYYASRHFWRPSSMLTSGIAKEYSKGISILKTVKLKLSYFRRLYFITRWHCSKSSSASLLSSLMCG